MPESALVIGPAILCFGIGVILALLDVHRFITEQGHGTAPIPYIATWETNLFFASIGAVSVALFWFSLAHPGGWIDNALALGTDSNYARAFLVGFGTIVLIRSKILEIQGNKIGFEYVYEFFRNWAVNAYKATASARKFSIAHKLASKTMAMSSFEDDLIAMTRNAIDHRGEDHRIKLNEELKDAAALKPKLDQIRYNEILIRTAIDFTNIRTVSKWIELNSQFTESHNERPSA